ncbi:MAG: hypothetical protein E6Q27_08790 [Aeromicrobium sp.]|nr:MAG: hypothetical protein E6Q27_08790 [Aeromicrobium sp.]
MAEATGANVVRAIAPLFAFSVLGILSTAAFQLLVIRQLGPGSFGILAAYLALINVASIGSSAVRNGVAVGVARADLGRVGARDGSLIESIVYGALFVVGVICMLLTGAYDSWWAGVWVALSVLPYFVFARAQGLMQGAGQVTRVLAWSTGAQIAQLVFALVALALGAGWLGVLFSTMIVALASASGATLQVFRGKLKSTVRPFSAVTVRALLITVVFTWLISMDVAWVQRFAPGEVAGEYGAAATLIKVAFLVPTTLALYLLPRFARKLEDKAYQARGLIWSAMAASLSGLGFALVLTLWPQLLTILFGASYENVGAIAAGVAFAFLPWVIAQSTVTQLTARAAPGPIILLVLAAVAQYFLAQMVLPDLGAWILAQGLLGSVVLLLMLAVFLIDRNRQN